MIPRALLIAFAPLLLAAGPVSHAHALVPQDLTALLSSLDGGDEVKARVERSVTSAAGDAKSSSHGTVVSRIEAGPGGLRVSWAPDQLQRAAEEQNSTDPDAASPNRQAMESLKPTELNEYLNFSGELLRNLKYAQLQGETKEVWENRPVRRLTFKVNPPLSEKDKKYIKELEATAEVRVDADGVPVALETRIRVKGRALLVIGFESKEKEEFRFQRIGKRLIVVRHVKESSGSGGGESNQSKSLTTLTVES